MHVAGRGTFRIRITHKNHCLAQTFEIYAVFIDTGGRREGTGEMVVVFAVFQSSLRDSACCGLHPGVETPGYFQVSLRDKGCKPKEHMIEASVGKIPDPISKFGGSRREEMRACNLM